MDIAANAGPFVYLAVLLGLGLLLKSTWFKGLVGEFLVNLALTFRLPKADYHLIKNVTLPTESGTTQIDHILVSRFGIFVIETKNMRGWIFGGAKQKQWTQQIFKHKSRFQNPLFQNYKHTKTLESLLELRSGSVISLIVFVGDSVFKTKMPENVVQSGACVSFIKGYNKHLLSDEQVQEAVSKIESGMLERSFKTNRAHVKHVRELVAEKESKSAATKPIASIDNPTDNPLTNNQTQVLCDRCGEVMVLRTVKKGPKVGKQFWGCSSYPKCRNTKNNA